MPVQWRHARVDGVGERRTPVRGLSVCLATWVVCGVTVWAVDSGARRASAQSGIDASSPQVQTPGPDSVEAFLGRLQQALDRDDAAALDALVAPAVPAVRRAGYLDSLRRSGDVRRVYQELERRSLPGVGDDDGRRLVLEVFEEWPGRARVRTVRLDLHRLPAGPEGSWQLFALEHLSTVDGLFRLRLDTSRQFAAQGLEIDAPDLRLTLKDGALFPIESDEGVTGVVVIGRGEMAFTPGPEAERGQLRLFSGSERLVTAFESALIRFHPSEYGRYIPLDTLRAVPVNSTVVRRATEIADRELPKTLTADLARVSSGTWHFLPRERDIVAEIRTRRYRTLTYSRFGLQAEDISLVDRARSLTISLYASESTLALRGRFYSDELQREYDVLDYSVEASLAVPRNAIRARAQLVLRALTPLTSLTLRLDEDLTVSGVVSEERGPLSHLRLKGQNAVSVRLPRPLQTGETLTLLVAYAGPVTSQRLGSEGQQVDVDVGFMVPDPHLLLSSASYWYPQNPFTDYATATLRLIVPPEHTAVASGQLAHDGAVVTLQGLDAPAGARTFVYRSEQPLRYLALVVSRFSRVHDEVLAVGAASGAGAGYTRVAAAIEAQHVQRTRARTLATPVADIMGFYASLLGDAPFPALTLAVVESHLPGGHAPGHFVLLNNPVFVPASTWQNDPAAFQGFPEFFLAHELAHQWWGQAVGTKNYHEQWISEGFAQYFAALYAQETRGDRVFHDMLRQFRRWSISQSDMGPVYLGQRLGQIRGGPRVFRALVYNKGAAVLHMLRRTVGDDAFFRALRHFYDSHRFRVAGTDDLRRVFEAESGQSLERFFDRWIYESGIPHVSNRSTITDGRAIVRLEQRGERVYDLPVTVTLTLADGTLQNVTVVMTDRSLEETIETDGRVRQIQVNRDSAALAEFGR